MKLGNTHKKGLIVLGLIMVCILAACGGENADDGECIHKFDTWSVERKASCTTDGSQSRTCQKCGYIESNTLPAVGHSVVVDKAVKATCTTAGLTEGKHCSECGETLAAQETIAAIGHTEVVDHAVTPTCTTTGLTEGKHCTTCNTVLVEQKTISAIGHTEVIDKEGKEPTCTEAGWTEQKHCSVCNMVLSNQTAVPAKGHTKVVDVEGKAATCTDGGWTEASHCSVCQVELSEKKLLEALGHVETTDMKKDATCTESGLTEGKHCSVCNYIFVKQTVIPATGHTVVKDEAVLATCVSTGLTEGSHCSVCNQVLVAQKTVDKTGTHTYVSGVCKHCGKSDPDYVPTYNAGEAWSVDGQWEMRLTSAQEHNHCSSYLTKYEGFKNEQIILLTFKYKNTGYGTSFEPKISSITVVDEQGEVARLYSSSDTNLIGCDHGVKPSACKNGLTAKMVLPYALDNHSQSVTVIVSIKDSTGNTRNAQFQIDIEAASEEDKLEGCTITVDGSLPKTISYYRSNSIQSSCSVTDISFEVSGDDLYIYFTGKKTYDSRGSGQSDSCKIGWKLYDDNNNVIASGTAYTLSIAVGEGFVKTKDTAYNCIEPGGTYRLVILNVN